jgi:hypothetical protein
MIIKMEQNNQLLNKLAEQLNLTRLKDDSPEPYTLTPDEEKEALEHAVNNARGFFKWKMEGLKYSPEEISLRILQKDWEKEIDREEVLKRANSNKNYAIWQLAQREKERIEQENHQKALKEAWSAARIKELMYWTSKNEYGKDFIVNEHNKPLIVAVCYFLSRDPRFETELGYDLKKGLLIRGVSGLGKTYIVRCAEENMLNPILFLSMLDITAAVQKDGEYFLKWADRKICYLDDVGTEQPEVLHFGTRIHWFKDFIENYYSRNKVYNRLMISTNHSFKEIEEKYGFRVRSRMKAMFNVIDVTGTDMR